MKKINFIITVAAGLLIISCKKENSETIPIQNEESSAVSGKNTAEQFNIFKGPQVNVGNGKVRSWIKISHEEVPIEMGLEFTPDALTGLPEHSGGNDPHPHWDIPLHQKAKDVTPFDHVELNWNPEGHEPVIFAAPHFDFHFYMISEAERLAITANDPAMEILPPLNQRPAGYVPTPGGIPAMGKHWIAPPIIPPFTRVMIWGSYNGKMTFVEPMATLSYLQSGATTAANFGQPQVFPKPGNYPTKYNIYKDDRGHHQVSLSQFVAR